jgi:hypothetical protein
MRQQVITTNQYRVVNQPYGKFSVQRLEILKARKRDLVELIFRVPEIKDSEAWTWLNTYGDAAEPWWHHKVFDSFEEAQHFMEWCKKQI